MILALLFLFLPVLAFAGSVNFGGEGDGSTLTGGTGSGSMTYSIPAAAPVSPPSCSGVFFFDEFTEAGTGNINLADHFPEIGSLWIGAGASDGTVVLDRGNDEIKSTDSGGNTRRVYSNVDADCADYSVFGSAKTGSTGSSHRVGVLGRWRESSGGNGYIFIIRGDATAYLQKVTNGTTLDLDTDTIAGFSPSTYYSLELRMIGATISGYVNGILECTAMDSTHTLSGTNGVLVRNANVRMTLTGTVYE